VQNLNTFCAALPVAKKQEMAAMYKLQADNLDAKLELAPEHKAKKKKEKKAKAGEQLSADQQLAAIIKTINSNKTK